jgi:hypothetical protein
MVQLKKHAGNDAYFAYTARYDVGTFPVEPNRNLILRPGNCTDRRGVCDCLSALSAPIVDTGKVQWH